MYQAITILHSYTRWFVLLSLVYAIVRANKGFRSKLGFTKSDNRLRHWTATMAHVQLVLGILLYTQSPVVKYFWQSYREGIKNLDGLFFAILHMTFMLMAIVVITIGSAMAKRKAVDHEKFKTMLIWYAIALLIILIAIPWPFSPLANRPYIR